MDAYSKLFGLKHSYRVLVVEDNRDIARLVTVFLRHYGFEVRTLSSGGLVLATVRAFRPDLVLLDIGLPDLNGYQVAELIRADPEVGNVLIIATSAYNPEMNPRELSLARFDHYLVKPVNFNSLLSTMQSALG